MNPFYLAIVTVLLVIAFVLIFSFILDRKENKTVSPPQRDNSQHQHSQNRQNNEDDGDFLTSAVIGEITGNPGIGAAVGGSLSGGVVGAILSDDDNSSSDCSFDSDD